MSGESTATVAAEPPCLGWIQVDEKTLLALRLIAGSHDMTVPQVVRMLTIDHAREKEFPIWNDKDLGHD